MEWAGLIGAAGAGLVVGAIVGLLAARGRAAVVRQQPGAPADRGATVNGRTATATGADDPRAEAARRSLDALRVGVVVLDPQDEPVLANPSARAMGLLRAGPRPGTAAAHPIVRTLAGQVRRSGTRRQVQLDLPRSSDAGVADPLGVLMHAVALRGGYVAVEAADATESHRVARMRRDFVANVGHELKTPIGALQLLSEALLDATTAAAAAEGETSSTDPAEDTAAARRFAERIQQESARLGSLVTDLLELSRVQGAEPLPEPTPVSVDGVIAEVLDRARTGASAKRIDLTVSGERGLTAYGSDAQLATALTNLVENAVAYSPEDSPVELTTRSSDEWISVEVSDRGIGIAVEDLDRIFERFYRSDRARSRATGGTGLGLAIVKHIATNHGGRVDVTSAPGEGSTFTLRLPARPPVGEGPAGGRRAV